MSQYTIDQKITAISRELAMRRRVYPRQVEQGRMPERRAQEEIGVMEAILADYQSQQKKEPDLFGMEGGAR